MGSPDFSLPSLHALINAGHDVVRVYAQPPKPAGRGHKETPCPVHAEAIRLGIEARTPKSLRDPDEHTAISDLGLDCAVIVAYGLILPLEILDAPRLGCLNVHASLLPRWRGAAPIQRALIAGDTETGVGIMKMDAGLDTGGVLSKARTPITDDETASSLHDRLADMGANLLVETLDRYAAGDITPTPQPDIGVTYAHKLERGEGRLDFNKSAAELERTVRALNPWPGTWFEFAGERIKVAAAKVVTGGSGTPGVVLDEHLTISCGDGALRPLRLQRPGKSMTDVDAFLRGYPIASQTRLDSPTG